MPTPLDYRQPEAGGLPRWAGILLALALVLDVAAVVLVLAGVIFRII